MPFIGSDALTTLRQELRRYVQGEASGRSFLISGHRGSGKTALVQRAVDELGDELFDTWNARAKPGFAPNSLPRPPQRPFLIKVYGPSLLTDDLPMPGGGEVGNPEAEGGDANPKATARDTSHGALVQITIALYRALAGEFADAYMIHARHAHGMRAADQLEWAAQFRLELDGTPDPATLRGYWDELDALRGGIIWPRTIGEALSAYGFADQGMREIVALATAAQAFQVCSGIVKYSQSKKSSDAVERTAETKAGVDLRDLVGRLMSLTIGGLVGLGAATALDVAPAAGAGAGLLGSMAVNWSSKRSAKRERSDDYTFILDRSVETLERDLPLVIERLRLAGLAPVFLVDELDKIDDPVPTMRKLIRRMKHLTTDYGFFCFLTNRDYFDAVQQLVEKTAFPEEHTFFSDRLFVLYRPRELTEFLERMIVVEAPPSNAPRPTGGGIDLEALARDILIKRIVLRSRLNTIGIIRELSRGWGENGETIESPDFIRSGIHFHLAVALQLAIEYLLGERDLKLRLDRDGGFRQSAIDALYLIAQDWERDIKSLDLSDIATAKRLLAARGGTPDEIRSDPVDTLGVSIGEDEREHLFTLISRLANLLSDFNALCDTLDQWGVLPHMVRVIRDTWPKKMLEHDESGSKQYRSLYDLDGNARGLNSSDQRVQDALDFLGGLHKRLRRVGIKLNDLASLGIMPATVSDEAAALAVERIVRSYESRKRHDEFENDLSLLDAIRSEFRRRSAEITAMFALLMAVSRAASGSSSRVVAAALAMRRHNALDNLSLNGILAMMPSGAVSLFQKLYSHDSSLTLSDLDILLDAAELIPVWGGQAAVLETADAWRRWADRVTQFLAGTPSDQLPIFADLVLTMRGERPISLLTGDLRQMSELEWAELCLHGIPVTLGTGPPLAPAWTVPAALLSLGFGAPLVAQVLASISVELPPPIEAAARNAPRGRAGILVVVADDAADELQTDRERGPYFMVRKSQTPYYKPALNWLVNLGVFRGYGNEQWDESRPTGDPDRGNPALP